MTPPSTPTLRSELRRGISPYNLGVALLAASLLALVEYVSSLAGLLPILLEGHPFLQALVVASLLFFFLSLLHITAHAYFGWRFQRGVEALAKGNPSKALQLLAIAERPGIDHYDVHGTVRQLVRSLRQPPV